MMNDKTNPSESNSMPAETSILPSRPTDTELNTSQPTPLSKRLSNGISPSSTPSTVENLTTNETKLSTIETKLPPTSSSPNKPAPSFQNDHFKRPSFIPTHATAKSVAEMTKSILENPHNHCQPCDPNYKVCQHIRVFGWELGKCADCHKIIPGREQLEQTKAAIAVAEDANLTVYELAAACHGRAVTIEWLIAFTFDHNCWSRPTWQVVRDIVIPSTISTRCRYNRKSVV